MTAILFTVFVVAMLIGVPITFALGIAALAALLYVDLPLMVIAQRMVPALADASALVAIPLFILAGNILSYGGMGDRLIHLANLIVGRTRGGLSSANVTASMFFGGISGSATADTSAIGSVMIPSMEKQGYDRAFATAVTVISSPLGTIIPPSIVMIVYCWVTETSIAKMFAAGYLPGILIGVMLMLTGWVISVRKNYPTAPRYTLREQLKIFADTLPGLMMPALIIGGILGGIFTATEAAAVAVIYGLLVSVFYYKELRWSHLPDIFLETIKLTGVVALLLAMAAVFSWLMAYDRLPYQVAGILADFQPSTTVFLVLYIAILLFLGLFLAPTEGLIIAVPILYPAALAIGIDPLHFGIITVVTLGLGHVTPPVGLCLFVGAAVSKLPMGQIIRAMLPFYAAAALALLLIAAFPIISTGIPWLLGM
jgi:tripartite ATP-independent transporter DctM subunit